jgi:hypothetical protein
MGVTKTGLQFYSAACVWACLMSGQAIASENRVAFKGAMVNGGCNTSAAAGQVQQGVVSLKTDGQRAPDPDLFRTACGQQKLPLQAHYAERASDDAKSRLGVMTLTYP